MSSTSVVLGSLAGLLAGATIAAGQRRPLPRPLPTPLADRPAMAVPSARDRRGLVVAALVLVTVLTAVVAPPLAGLVLLGAWVWHRSRIYRWHRAHAHAVATGLPDVVDLLLLCAGAGLSVPLAHPLVAERTPGPVGDALRAAELTALGGGARADGLLAELAPLGDRSAALAHVLVDHLRYGVPVVPGLERLGHELRLDRRRRAEEAARRVPVRMVGPLVVCVLPAFALLTVVPLLAASLSGLPT